MTKIGYIYCFKNIINNKRYIGQTSNPKKRWKFYAIHKPGKSAFCDAINKYGISSFHLEWVFDVEIFEIDNFSSNIKTSLDFLEVVAISLFNTFDNKEKGYNLSPGGNGNIRHSRCAIQKMRLAQLGENNNMYGKKHTIQTKRKMSFSKMGKKMIFKHEDEWRKNMSIVQKKIQNRPEIKLKKTIALKKRIRSKTSYIKASLNNPKRKAIRQLSLDGEFIAEFHSISEAKRQLGITAAINKAAAGKLANGNIAGGYRWEWCKNE